ncbi:MAG: FtsQ-type POTRA domain-containing protein [Gammaproteobacteria bacterium]|nr:FtsQ-type POTRA domain-containing protein [Gammaproteobacteria bacterium]MBU1725235.1 FtsQ-type POTRA domain-containing protein [Gammaproteobacteria bacterium]MBU2005835.1 FtsQ-type POTRA domain-containing protein [Gammaproteobacteria bacterium]
MVQRRRQAAKRPRPGFDLAKISPSVMKLAVVFALVMVFLGGGLGLRAMLNNPENWRISQVDVQGELKFIKDADLRSIIEKYTQTNLYLLDVDALDAAIKTQPWVRAVTLRKAWPSQLVVEVEEQRPVAFWGKERLMNQYGELFAAELPSMQGVFPTLYSPEDRGREMGERFIQVRDWLKGLPLEISELTEDERGSWRMKIKKGPEVLIGTEDQERRVERFRVGFLQELVGKLANVRRVDLRYTNGFAVEWKQSPVGSVDVTGGSRRS